MEALQPLHPRLPHGGVGSDVPASRLLFYLYALLVVVLSTLLDRSFLLDQQNYIDNFIESASLEWVRAMFEEESLLRGAITQLFSEELLWRLWTTGFGLVLDPTTAVFITVCVLNGLMILAAARTDGPSLALALWLVLPVGFAVTGLEQIRQGFGLGVVLYIALRMNRPVLGSLIAAMIHTTFALAFVFGVIHWLFKKRPLLALACSVSLAFAGAYLGGMLFEMFGGRRLMVYSSTEGDATSINYVFAGILCILPSLYWLVTTTRQENEDPQAWTLSNLALVHVAATCFTIFSFFMFPIGAGRIGYLTQLLLIPILPALLKRRHSNVTFAISALLFLYLIYLTGKSYSDGVYAILLGR
ncbi:MAG TPA: EpsG family protein [Steroidobacter sp.]|uniref:EpsG family protein n=1 Tax=Steroidobacter sp. TaxID=1978227 RepID=UPI002ED7EA67